MQGLKQSLKSLMLGITLGAVQFVPVIYPAALHAEVSGHTMVDFTNYPIMASEGTVASQPMVIINTSNDHQLYYKAYNDFTDLDPAANDGIEITYKHAIDYYGYFDSYKCYTYNSAYTVTGLVGSGRFEPTSDVDADKYCNGSAWSGNFLNWASMARIDAIRKILFGGHRRVDTETDTVLERTYLPNDAHSWAKYYNGSDINQLTPFSTSEITLCNTTPDITSQRVSETVDSPPLIRVAAGNYALWAANERWQCLWREELDSLNMWADVGKNGNVPANSGMDAQDDSPVKADMGLGSVDYTARVQACVDGKIGKEACRPYPSGHYKPRGLLQVYGEDDLLHFGMFSGSYTLNKSGGILVKDVGTFTDEIDTTTGRFTKVYHTAQVGGLPSNQVNEATGIVNTWSLWRIVKYRHDDGTYGMGTIGANDCPNKSSSFLDGQCMNWGNPFAEIYLNALRYFAGESVSGTFRTNDSSTIEALNTPQTWKCPLDDSNYCSSLNIINFNASVISYDADQLDDNSDGIGALGAPLNSAGLTDIVGDGEGISGNAYFVGGNGVTNDQLCTSKNITGLGSVLGLCPEGPRLEGSYRLAGLAHWAHTNDIRPETAGSRALPEEQRVDTYSVALASSLPKIDIPIPGGSGNNVRILPSCRSVDSDTGNPVGNCAIVDFKIVTPHSETNGVGSGKYYVNWEDTEQGGDYDQDMWGTIEYSITSNAITVTTDTHSASACCQMGFGYVISGTTTDGFQVHSGAADYTDTNGFTFNAGVTSCVDCRVEDAANSHTYDIGTSAAGLLEDPLNYAAKWGGFDDQDGNDIPNLQAEWDNRDAAWIKGNQDGIPDNYFHATNPAALEAALIRVFNDILSKTASGTAAAVVANSRQGTGAIYQALYQTNKTDQNGLTASWFGNLQAFWIDQQGLMREDDGDTVLEDYSIDKVVEIYFDRVEETPRFCRYSTDSDDKSIFTTSVQSTDDGICHSGDSGDLLDVGSLWDASEQLSALPATDITTQRSYTTAANSRRHILTWIDANYNDEVDSLEIVDFETGIDFRFLDVADQTAADALIDYIRGEEQPGSRSRTIDLDENGTSEVLRLGDIVNSTPTVVGAPAEAFDLLYKDPTYLTFRKHYRNRRQVVYVGANDGLLHAFNSGFFVEENGIFKFLESPLDGNGDPSATQHPLGAELWAYAPMNLLPHLKWLKDPDYTHVFYMDAKPRVFDAKIFTADADHPEGWGTVLVAGMRLGGGSMTVDLAGDGLDPTTVDDDTQMQSAYVVLDITNPEAPPELIAEIKAPGLGFTTSFPTAFAVRDSDNNGSNNWYLVFGSGPTEAAGVTSSQTAGLFIYDLAAKDFVTDYGPKALVDETNSFVGDPVSVDWNLSFKADSLYFGIIGGDAETPTGKLYKMRINRDPDPAGWGNPALFFDAGRPIVPTPTVSWDSAFNHWIHFGTGRMFAFDDTKSTGQQAIYGIRDLEDDVAVVAGDLVDVTDVKVFNDGVITGAAGADINSDGTTTFWELEELINRLDLSPADGTPDNKGWYKRLPYDDTLTEPSTRAFSTSALLGQVLFTTAFTPGSNQCEFEGESNLYGLFFKTGTAHPTIVILGEDASDENNNGGVRVLDSLDMGRGIASSPSLHTGGDRSGDGDNDVTVITQTGVGAIKKKDASTVSRVRSGEASWREEVNF